MLKTKPVHVFKNYNIWMFTKSKFSKRSSLNYAYTFSGEGSNIAKLILNYLDIKSSYPEGFSLYFSNASDADIMVDTANSGLLLKVLDKDPNGYICKLRWLDKTKSVTEPKLRYAKGWISNNLFDALGIKVRCGGWLRVHVKLFKLSN